MKIRKLVALENRHPLQTQRDKIKQCQTKLSNRLVCFRQHQSVLMPLIVDYAAQKFKKLVNPEEETLFLPSDFKATQQRTMGLTELGMAECELQQGQAYDAVLLLQRRVKDIRAVKTDKLKNDREQKQNTRSTTRLDALFIAHDLAIDTYNAARQALISLDFISEDDDSSQLVTRFGREQQSKGLWGIQDEVMVYFGGK